MDKTTLSILREAQDQLLSVDCDLDKIRAVHNVVTGNLFELAEPNINGYQYRYDHYYTLESVITELIGQAQKAVAKLETFLDMKAFSLSSHEKAVAPTLQSEATANIEPAQSRNPLPKYTPDSGTLQDISFKGCRRSIENSLKTAVALFHSHLSRSMFSQQLSLVSGKAIMAHELGAISRAELGELTVLIDEAEATGGHIA